MNYLRRFFSRALTIACACARVRTRRDFLPPSAPIFARYARNFLSTCLVSRSMIRATTGAFTEAAFSVYAPSIAVMHRRLQFVGDNASNRQNHVRAGNRMGNHHRKRIITLALDAGKLNRKCGIFQAMDVSNFLATEKVFSGVRVHVGNIT